MRVLILILLVFASRSFAEVQESHLHSGFMISPAQLYQVKDSRVDSIFYKDKTEQVVDQGEKDRSDYEVDLDTIGVAGAFRSETALLSIKANQLNANIQSTDTYEGTSATEKEKASGKMVTPGVAIQFDRLSVGFEQEYSNLEFEYGKIESQKTTGGITLYSDYGEIGMAFSPKSTSRYEYGEDASIEATEPAEHTLHGMFMFTKAFAVGAIAKQWLYEDVDEDDRASFSMEQNVRQLTALSEVRPSSNSRIGALIYHRTAGYKEDEDAYTDNLATNGAGIEAETKFNPYVSVGIMAQMSRAEKNVEKTENDSAKKLKNESKSMAVVMGVVF